MTALQSIMEMNKIIECAAPGDLTGALFDYFRKSYYVICALSDLSGNIICGAKNFEGSGSVYRAKIYVNNEAVYLLEAKAADKLSDDDWLLVCEFLKAVVGVTASCAALEETRMQDSVKIALTALTDSEAEALFIIMKSMDFKDGEVIYSRIAKENGITVSMVANTLKKIQSAGILETRSLGVKGTYIKIKNKHLITEIRRLCG